MKTLFASAAQRARVHSSRLASLLLVLFSSATLASGCVSTTDEAAGDGDGDSASLNDGNNGVTSCPVGETACNGFCVNLTNNATSCGVCGLSCSPGSSCVNSACSCQVGLNDCGTGCTDLNADAFNCGTCGTACAAGTVCSLGACSDTCAAGLTQCGANCVDPLTDVMNCGTCGNVCSNGTACVAGVCECPAGQTCDMGTPVGTGGSAGTGGAPGTGGDTATGGTTATGGAGTGGDTATGGAGTGGEGGGDGALGGYITSFDWKGYAFTSTWGSATISPEDFGDVTGFPLCATGNVPASTMGAHGAMVGWSINQGSEDGDPALTVMPTLDGISYNIESDAQLRLQIQGPDGATDEEDRWCAEIGTGATDGFVPWEVFNTKCWPGEEGTAYANQPISQVIVQVPAAATATSFDFCVNALAPSDSDGNQGGEGCDLNAVAQSPISGSMSEANNLDRKSANNGTPEYYVQNNAFNPPGGLNYDLNYDGNFFEIVTQSGSQPTNGAPIAYPSLFIGSNGGDGLATRGSNLAKRVSELTDVPTALRWTAPSSGQYNVAYDVWFSPSAGDQGPGSRSFLMVWFHRTPGILAEGEGEGHSGGIFTINGKSFNTYISTQFEGRPIVSYVATSRIDEWSFDLNDFINDAKTRNDSSGNGNGGNPAISDSLYLTNIFGGVEIWSGSQGLAVDRFCAEVK